MIAFGVEHVQPECAQYRLLSLFQVDSLFGAGFGES